MGLRMSRATPETDLHTAVVAWLRLVLPSDCLLHHSPNEGVRKVQYRRKLSRMGLRPGWPDLQLVVPPTYYLDGERQTGIYIELKAPKGRLSEAQREVIARLLAARRHVAVCRSLDDVQDFLRGIIRLHK
jgi:hypothetical protein